jgi:CubicO group peptidase (beta-lactamase class C family)
VIIEELSGMSYNEFIQTRIFDPLNMNNANFSITDMQKTSDFAKPYKEEEGKVVECEFIDNDVVSGAGCINASIEDMGKWLQFHLNLGKINDQRLNGEAFIEPIQDVQSCMPFVSTYIFFMQPYNIQNSVDN